MCYLSRGLFESHSQSQFEVFCYSYGPHDVTSDCGLRIRELCGHRFYDVSEGYSAKDIAELIRKHEIAISVDLMGLTTNALPEILAHKPSAIALSYLGYPGTTGLPFVDYTIIDPVVTPPHQVGSSFSEKVVYLPSSYQVNYYEESDPYCGGVLACKVELKRR
jgi:protein O-GlcNAc transferase